MDDLDILIRELALEQDACHSINIPERLTEKRELLRSLMNLRPPLPLSTHLLELQDAELGRQLAEKGMVQPVEIAAISSDSRLKLWQGDITRLRVDAIVNAANSQMLGCFVPMHRCVDNAIHSAAGMQLRLECHELMQAQGHPEPTGLAKITKGYNLPASYVIHTVGPIVVHERADLTEQNQLEACYRSCLTLADEKSLKSISFCCISTGEFRFPNTQAAEIAVNMVRSYLALHPDTHIDTIVFNVFKDMDLMIYTDLLLRIA
jgi:O-acetyl-ADP-ribose deacetylase (regulator of RNase III)